LEIGDTAGFRNLRYVGILLVSAVASGQQKKFENHLATFSLNLALGIAGVLQTAESCPPNC
jgi:hypothetical protein